MLNTHINQSKFVDYTYIKKYICLFYFGIYCLSATSQILDFKNITTKDGLLSDEVYNLYQDKKGYVYIFSNNGTIKFDGHHFTPILKNLPPKESFIFTISENEFGKIWVANSNAKIYEVENDSAKIINGIESVSKLLKNSVSEIFKLYIDDSLNIYVIAKGHTYKLVKGVKLYHPIDLSNSGKFDSVLIKVIQMKDEIVTIQNRFPNDDYILKKSNRKLYLKFINENRLFSLPPLPYYFAFKNFKRYSNDVFFSYASNVGIINQTNKLNYIDFKSIVIKYVADKNNHIWVGCRNGGLFELDENRVIINHYLNSYTINDILVDNNNSLWVSTPGSGLFNVKNLKDYRFNDFEPLGNSVSWITKIGNCVFVGCNIGKIYKIENEFRKEISLLENASSTGIFKYNRDYLVPHSIAVEKLYLDKSKVKTNFRGKGEKTYNIIQKSTDTLIFVWRRGITYYINEKPVKQIDFGCKITASALNNNTLWLGTEDGVYSYKPVFNNRSKNIKNVLVPDLETLERSPSLQETKDAIISNIVYGPDQKLWFCTFGEGIYVLDKNSMSHYSLNNGLPTDIVNNLSFTNEGKAILSGNNGLYIGEKYTEFNGYQKWNQYYTGEVKHGLEYMNQLYLISKSGLVIIDYKNRNLSSKNSFFNWASVYVNSILKSKEQLDKQLNSSAQIQFNFDLITFTEQDEYIHYKLVGTKMDTGMVKGRSLSFRNLIPGNYLLQVYPMIPRGKLLTINIPFQVPPKFYETVIFKFSLFIVILLVLSLVLYLVYRGMQNRETKRIQNEQQLLEYKLIALKAQINPHFMSNCLSAIQHLIINDDNERAAFYIAKFGLLVRQILDFSAQQTITLEEELELLNLYLELEQLRFKNKFEFEFVVENSLNLKTIFIPPLLINPIVENAIWHGLLPVELERKGRLSVELKTEKDKLMIIITDNGNGRVESKKVIRAKYRKSYGLKITEQRLKNLNYLFNKNTSILFYTDLFDQKNKACGTQVAFYIPIILKPIAYENN